MPTTVDEIESRLTAKIPSARAEVRDTTGGGDHFAVRIESPAFTGLSRIKQHKLVYESLDDLMADGAIHALSIKTVPAINPDN